MKRKELTKTLKWSQIEKNPSWSIHKYISVVRVIPSGWHPRGQYLPQPPTSAWMPVDVAFSLGCHCGDSTHGDVLFSRWSSYTCLFFPPSSGVIITRPPQKHRHLLFSLLFFHSLFFSANSRVWFVGMISQSVCDISNFTSENVQVLPPHCQYGEPKSYFYKAMQYLWQSCV